MEIPQGKSMCNYLCLKQEKCYFLKKIFCSSAKLENGRAEFWPQWEKGDGGREGGG
jgi:hypothetical protein